MNNLVRKSVDWRACPAVERQEGKVSGAWVFRGTRVPLSALLENLHDGVTVDEFLRWFPGVAREQVIQVLGHLKTVTWSDLLPIRHQPTNTPKD